MIAYRHANIEKYLHGIAFKVVSHLPWGQGLLARFAIWLPCFKGRQTGTAIERLVNAVLLEDICGDERQLNLPNSGPCVSAPLGKKQIPVMVTEIYILHAKCLTGLKFLM
jgi:hypothetical protein